VRDSSKRDNQVRQDVEHLISEAMKQPGVKEALAINDTYQELLGKTYLYSAENCLSQVISTNRSG